MTKEEEVVEAWQVAALASAVKADQAVKGILIKTGSSRRTLHRPRKGRQSS